MTFLRTLVAPAPAIDPAQRLRAALQLADDGVAVHRARLRREQPEASDAVIDELLAVWRRDRPAPGEGCPGFRRSQRFTR